MFYVDLTYSIVKAVLDIKPAGASYIDWDAHADIHELPIDDLLVGASGCSFTYEDASTIDVSFAVGVATKNDDNLFNLRTTISNYFEAFRPETKVPLYDRALIQAGAPIEPYTWMVITTPITLLPINRAESRNVQFLNVGGLVNPAALRAS